MRTRHEDEKIGWAICDELIRNRMVSSTAKRFLDNTEACVIGGLFCDAYREGDMTKLAAEVEEFADEDLLYMWWDEIKELMVDSVREEVHSEFSPCSNRKFLTEYCKRDRRFADLVWREFEIGVDIA